MVDARPEVGRLVIASSARTVWALSGDHYSWLTSLVSAHCLERLTCRLIAATTFLLGLVPLALIQAERGPHTTVHAVVAVLMALCSTVIAGIWMTRGWPTRNRSRASAMLATVCIAAAVTTTADPLTGAVIAMAFAGPTGYTALFHSRATVAATWAIATPTLVVTAIRLAAADVQLAIVVVPLTLTINVVATYAALLVVYLIPTKVPSERLDPLTGLLNRAGLEEQLAIILGARSRAQDRHLVVVVVGVDTHGLMMSLGKGIHADRACIRAARRLRGTVRRDAALAYCGDGEFLIADLFDTADPSDMLERIRGTLTERPAQLSASIGAVSTPLAPLSTYPAKDVLDALEGLATHHGHRAHRTGGNSARVAINPTLTLLDDPHEAI